MAHNAEGPSAGSLQHTIEEFVIQVRTMPRGGDLEGLIEESAAELKLLLYEVAARERQQSTAAAPADFPPSGLCALSADDAPARG